MTIGKKEILTQLFSWNHKLNVLDANGSTGTEVWQRIVGDVDLDTARKHALRASGDYRRILWNPESVENQIIRNEIEILSRDELITTILFNEVIFIRGNIERTFYFPEPVEPKEDATTEEFEEFQLKSDSFEKDRSEALNKVILEKLTERKEELDSESDDELKNIIFSTKVNNECEMKLKTRFAEMCTYLGTYTDKDFKHRLFSDFNEFNNQPELLKNQLIKGYSELEVSAVNLKGLAKVPSSGT